MRITDNKINVYNTDFFIKKNKRMTFTGIKAVNNYMHPQLQIKKFLSIEELKNKLLQKISEMVKFSKNPEIRKPTEYMIESAKSIEQLFLINSVLSKDFFHTEEKLHKAKEIINACNSSARVNFVFKVLSNENLYQNNNLLNKLESVLYTFDTRTCSYEPKNIVLNKVLSSENLYKNKGFIDNLGSILYSTEDHVTSYKAENVLDAVLENENLSNDEKFIQALGEIFSIIDIAKYTNIKIKSTLKEFEANPKQYYLILSIINLLGTEATDVLTKKIFKNKKFLDDKKFLSFLPAIIYSINNKNYNKSDDIINYIQKNKTLNDEDFNHSMISEYMHGQYNSLSDAEKFVRIKTKAFEKKEQLGVRSIEIETFFNESKQEILTSVELLGEKNFLHAFSLKLSGLKELCSDCQIIKDFINEDYYEKLLLKINPKASSRYKELERKLLNLKKLHHIIKKKNNAVKLKKLENDINTITKEARGILANKLQIDPDRTIERIRILAGLFDRQDDRNDKIRNEKCCELIDLLQNSTSVSDKAWNKFCNEMVFKKVSIDYDQDVANKLNLINSKYLSKIILANIDFLIGLREIILLIKNNPNKTIKEIFNELPSNKITRSEFDRHGINYENWISFDKNSKITLKDENNRNITIKKVDMNNISKALFLGNEASCCTKVGRGTKQATAPTYLKNKFIGAIEILDDEISIGNTMCYFAEVGREVALILDNIEILNLYKDNDNIRGGLIKYAEKLSAEVGKPDIAIYIGGHRNKVNLSNFESGHYYLKPIGNSGDDKIYFDFLTSFNKVGPKTFFDAELTKVK